MSCSPFPQKLLPETSRAFAAPLEHDAPETSQWNRPLSMKSVAFELTWCPQKIQFGKQQIQPLGFGNITI